MALAAFPPGGKNKKLKKLCFPREGNLGKHYQTNFLHYNQTLISYVS
ncbi:hypothetical protein HMPREF9140_00819 [Prevotella micans F0438]|uniref:Uncharacterized protein n=1 Tax=Prevotella micans F0438 TaxID=883158 RepID=H1Q1N1_9BACT|nr:hypothetical protein HMPREF9140_00819 [Prevotella micans F0438]